MSSTKWKEIFSYQCAVKQPYEQEYPHEGVILTSIDASVNTQEELRAHNESHDQLWTMFFFLY